MVSRVVVFNDASVARGGATGLALLSIRMLRERGIAVTYIVGDSGNAPELADLGVEVVAVGGRQLVQENKLKAASRGIYNTHARRVAADWISANDRPNTVYHLHGWSKILSPAIFDALRPVASRTLIHAHDFFLACPNGAYMDYQKVEPCERVPLGASCLSTNCDKRSYPQKLWRVARQTALLKSLDKSGPWGGIAMIHETMAPYLEKAGFPPRMLTTVRNPAEAFCAERIAAEANRAFFFVGRVEAEKGIEDLIEAAQLAGVPLKVIGDGPLREELSRAHPEVEFFGWRSRDEIAALIRHARAVVMPSRYPEPFGLVAAEASLSGLPVILSRTAFLGREIAEGGIGFVCEGRDREAFAATLGDMRDLPAADIRQMSERAFSGNVSLANSPAAWIDALLELYRGALSAPAKAAA